MIDYIISRQYRTGRSLTQMISQCAMIIHSFQVIPQSTKKKTSESNLGIVDVHGTILSLFIESYIAHTDIWHMLINISELYSLIWVFS